MIKSKSGQLPNLSFTIQACPEYDNVVVFRTCFLIRATKYLDYFIGLMKEYMLIEPCIGCGYGRDSVLLGKDPHLFQKEKFFHFCTRDELERDFCFLDIRELAATFHILRIIIIGQFLVVLPRLMKMGYTVIN
jgi:hypothetical protein